MLNGIYNIAHAITYMYKHTSVQYKHATGWREIKHVSPISTILSIALLLAIVALVITASILTV